MDMGKEIICIFFGGKYNEVESILYLLIYDTNRPDNRSGYLDLWYRIMSINSKIMVG
jgi:hypothetical protein